MERQRGDGATDQAAQDRGGQRSDALAAESAGTRISAIVARSGPALVVRQRGFGLLWLGETVSQIGDGLNRVALLWFVYQTQHSALRTSLVGVLQTLPALVLSPVIGVYLDRWSKKRTLIAINVIHGLLVALIPLLFAVGQLTLLRLYALVLVTSVVATIYGPALTLVVPLIVPETELRAANALVQSTGTIGLLFGPVVAGVAISALGTANVLYLDAATFFFAVGCLAFIPVRERLPAVRPIVALSQFLQEIGEGLRFMVRRQTGIMVLTLVTALQTFGASAFMFLLPTFARHTLGGHSTSSLGGFWSAYGAGMLLATLLITVLRDDPRRGLMWYVPAALAAGGAAVVALSRLHGWFTGVALMLVIGFAVASLSPVVTTLLQEGTPEDLRGRVLTTYNTTNMAMAMIGMVAFGWLADRAGEAITLVTIGSVLFAAAIALRVFSWSGPARTLVAKVTATASDHG